MKKLILAALLLVSLSTNVHAQRAIFNLTTDNTFSDTVFVAIANKLLLLGPSREFTSITSPDGSVRRSGDTLTFLPHKPGKVTISYSGKENAGTLQLRAVHLPAPVTVLTVSYLPGIGSLKRLPVYSLEMNLPGANSLLKDFNVTSFDLLLGDSIHNVMGNVIPASLVQTSFDHDNRKVTVLNVSAGSPGSRRAVLKQKQVFALD